MAKDTYYFSHDYNARNDKKISALVCEFKAAGYGIFWATCEMMHEEGGKLEFDELTIKAIAKDINEESEFVKTVIEKCIEKFKLFTKQGILLQSNRVARNLESKNEKKYKKAEAGRLGGIKSGESRRNVNNSEAKRSNASSNEPNKIKVKESKGKEIKGKEKKGIEIITNADGKEKNYDFNEILNPTSFPTWRAECSAFLKDEYFKQGFCKDQNLPMGNLEELMREFVKKLNLENDFKNAGGLKVHFTRHYKKHLNGKVYTAFTQSKGFIDVPDNLDYDKMETW